MPPARLDLRPQPALGEEVEEARVGAELGAEQRGDRLLQQRLDPVEVRLRRNAPRTRKEKIAAFEREERERAERNNGLAFDDDASFST